MEINLSAAVIARLVRAIHLSHRAEEWTTRTSRVVTLCRNDVPQKQKSRAHCPAS
ncbi:hypothetical protein [Devosia sp. 2618]|uniref:hypothetical protein n=1 Tax=Devosia sp. 2618 TaxID=3156454 RepID=UPI0033955BC3